MYRLCPKCEINYILNDSDDVCEVCKQVTTINPGPRDPNKAMVEKDLLPILRSLNDVAIDKLTRKADSFEFLGLRLPLLIKCKDEGIETCRQEIKDDKGHNRYYINAYLIGGQKYHICSQWWSAVGNNSKDILKILKHIEKK